MNATTLTEPVKHIPVGMNDCSQCSSKQGILTIAVVTNATAFLGIRLFKTSSVKACLNCASCGRDIKKAAWPTTVKTLAYNESRQVPLSFWRRYGGWVVVLLVLLLAECLHRFI